jgi:hypothetical protein
MMDNSRQRHNLDLILLLVNYIIQQNSKCLHLHPVKLIIDKMNKLIPGLIVLAVLAGCSSGNKWSFSGHSIVTVE